MTRTMEVEIYGQRYAIKGEADEAYMKRLAAYVDAQMRALAQDTKHATLAKLAILVAINTAHQLFQMEASQQQEVTQLEQRAATLLNSIEAQLSVRSGD